MATSNISSSFSSSFFLITLLLFSCFASCCLSYTFADDNPIRLVSDGLRDNNLPHDDDDPFFPSLGVEAIYQFGDSRSDTGNLMRDDPSTNCANWPYGETFFNHPTGRCSNGLLMIDFFAKFLNLPLIDAYLDKEGKFTHGVNFAVAGSTALNVSVLAEKYEIESPTNLSLNVQLGWFRSHFDSYYTNASERKRKLANGLFFMGEVGGNDYNFAFYQGKSMQDAYRLVHDVLQVIRNAVEDIIDLGATYIVIPGNFPIGCVPLYLVQHKTNDSNMYDELNCLKEYNDHAKFHNKLLQQSILELQKDHPNVKIVYMDYFEALREILRHADSLGFSEKGLQEPCCGGQSIDMYCGMDGYSVCENPQEYISWDGTHFTQRAYHLMAKQVMKSSILGAFRNNVA